MLAHISLCNIVKDILIHKNQSVCALSILPCHRVSSSVFIKKNSDNRRYYHRSAPPLPPPQQSSLFRSLLGLTVVVGGISATVYLNQTSRDYVETQFPQMKEYFTQLDNYISYGRETTSSLRMPSIEMPSLPTSLSSMTSFFKRDAGSQPLIPGTQPQLYNRKASSVADNYNEFDLSAVSNDDKELSIPSTVYDFNQAVLRGTEDLAGSVAKVDVQTAIAHTERSVKEALADLEQLKMATKRKLEALNSSEGKWNLSSLDAKVEAAQRKASQTHQLALKHRAELRAALDLANVSITSLEEMEANKRAISRYGDLGYALSGSMNEVLRLQNHLKTQMDFSTKNLIDFKKLQDEVKSIFPGIASGSSKLSREELHSMLSMALERVDRVCESIEASGLQSERRLASAMQMHRQACDRLVREAVGCEVEKLTTQHELDRIEWKEETKKRIDHELDAALARHGHHLAHMLRLKQDELEHQFVCRQREALIAQKDEFEGELAKWIQRMKGIEHVVDGRANIDRIAKETQSLWLAVEALAFTLEMPVSAISVTGRSERNDVRPFYTSEPLLPFVAAVRKAADALGTEDEFSQRVLESLPERALVEGVCTRQGLLHRFNKVYQVSRDVAMVPETSDSLWGYFVSWLQSKLVFDRMGRHRLVSHLQGDYPALLTPETQLPDDVGAAAPDTFVLLASAKAALMPETDADVNVDSTNSADIDFAVRLLGQLKGQSGVVVSDWLRDARQFLEVHQAVQALLAYATASNISAFEQRL